MHASQNSLTSIETMLKRHFLPFLHAIPIASLL